MRRGSRCVPPAPGIIPREVSVRPSLTCAAATRKSQAKANSRPPPKATPFSTAMTG